jgi:DNA helicase-2/ATP-dependent DNA helicase PcrA
VESGSPAFSSSSSQRPAPQFRKVSSTTGSSDALPTVSSINGLELGSKVMHDRFGVGIVKRLEGSGDSAKATVEFVNAGTKQLLLKFAKIKLIG